METKTINTLLASLVEKMEAEISKIQRELDKLGGNSVDDYRLGQISGIDQCITIIKEAMK